MFPGRSLGLFLSFWANVLSEHFSVMRLFNIGSIDNLLAVDSYVLSEHVLP